MLQHFYYPLLGFMSLVIFFFAGMRGDGTGEGFDFQIGMMRMVRVLVAYFVGPYLAYLLIRESLEVIFKFPNPDKERLMNFVFYCTGFLMALEMLMAVFPAIRYFQFIAVYLVFITWNGSHTYIRVDERKRWLFGFLSFLIIFFSPGVIYQVLKFLQG